MVGTAMLIDPIITECVRQPRIRDRLMAHLAEGDAPCCRAGARTPGGAVVCIARLHGVLATYRFSTPSSLTLSVTSCAQGRATAKKMLKHSIPRNPYGQFILHALDPPGRPPDVTAGPYPGRGTRHVPAPGPLPPRPRHAVCRDQPAGASSHRAIRRNYEGQLALDTRSFCLLSDEGGQHLFRKQPHLPVNLVDPLVAEQPYIPKRAHQMV